MFEIVSLPKKKLSLKFAYVKVTAFFKGEVLFPFTQKFLLLLEIVLKGVWVVGAALEVALGLASCVGVVHCCCKKILVLNL